MLDFSIIDSPVLLKCGAEQRFSVTEWKTDVKSYLWGRAVMIKDPLAAELFGSKDNSANRLIRAADRPRSEQSTCCIHAAEGAAWWASFALGWKDGGADLGINKSKSFSMITSPFLPHKASVPLIMGANCNEAEALHKCDLRFKKGYVLLSLKPQKKHAVENRGHVFSVDHMMRWGGC